MGVEEIGRLTPGICKYSPASGGGVAVLSQAEWAGMLAGLSRDAENFARAKYAGDEDAFWKLVFSVRVWAAGLAFKEGWEIVRGRPTVYNLSAIAVYEAVSPNRCGTCRGTGYRGVRLCQTCNGVGIGKLSGADVAACCGLELQHYYRKWRPRYESVYGYVVDFDGEVVRVLRRQDQVVSDLAFKAV